MKIYHLVILLRKFFDSRGVGRGQGGRRIVLLNLRWGNFFHEAQTINSTQQLGPQKRRLQLKMRLKARTYISLSSHTLVKSLTFNLSLRLWGPCYC
jgi:hypothetical protein